MKPLDETKICLITAVNRPEEYNRSLRSWKKIRVPMSMTLESRVVQDATSLTEAYQAAMESSDAKYKVYVHQDVEIVDSAFFETMIREFQAQPKLGIAGVVGCIQLPSTAVWWEGYLIGAICDDSSGEFLSYLYYRNTQHTLPAEALDGVLLATQQDIPWRTDLFNGWHCYDLSQCMEFRRAGYFAGVLPQREAACVHRCGHVPMEGFEEARQKFIQEYMTQNRK